MKVCTKCEALKPLDEFYVERRATDGRTSWCKSCKCAQSRDWQLANPVRDKELRKRDRLRNPDRERRRVRQWREENPERQARHEHASRHRHAQKESARLALRTAVREGALEKPDICDDCGMRVPDARDLHGHHEDYLKPLDVDWLCASCHGLRHHSIPLS